MSLAMKSFMRGGIAGLSWQVRGCVTSIVAEPTSKQLRQRRCSQALPGARQQNAGVVQIRAESRLQSLSKGQVDEQLLVYIHENTREPEVQRELRMETIQMMGSNNMQVSPDQGQFLAMLVKLTGAKECIEVGVFNGYSSLAIALALPDSGRLVACDRSEQSLGVARKYFDRAGVSHKVDIRLGMAIDSLNQLLLDDGDGRYDFAFLDADKEMYIKYYELLLQLLRPGGLLVVDNVLWKGQVADISIVDRKTQSIRDFNTFLLNDKRTDYSLVAIGDGMAMCRKL